MNISPPIIELAAALRSKILIEKIPFSFARAFISLLACIEVCFPDFFEVHHLKDPGVYFAQKKSEKKQFPRKRR